MDESPLGSISPSEQEKAELTFRRMSGEKQCTLCKSFVGRKSWNARNPHRLHGVLCTACRHELVKCDGCGGVVTRKTLQWPTLRLDDRHLLKGGVWPTTLSDYTWVCGWCENHCGVRTVVKIPDYGTLQISILHQYGHVRAEK